MLGVVTIIMGCQMTFGTSVGETKGTGDSDTVIINWFKWCNEAKCFGYGVTVK